MASRFFVTVDGLVRALTPAAIRCLRKSAIDDWAKAGYIPSTVQKWAGHADIKTTLTFYTQASQGEIDRAANATMLKSDTTSDTTARTEKSACAVSA